MIEAIVSAFACGLGGVVVFLAIIGLCRIVEEYSATDVDEVTEPRE